MFHVYCATSKDLSDWDDYGCFCDSTQTASLVIERQQVDETDKCCKEHDKCYVAAPSSCDCHKVQSFAFNARCNDWKLAKGFCEDVFRISQNDECKHYCCQCDFIGAECLAHRRNTKTDRLWRNWLDPTKSQCNQRCGKVPGCDCKPGINCFCRVVQPFLKNEGFCSKLTTNLCIHLLTEVKL